MCSTPTPAAAPFCARRRKTCLHPITAPCLISRFPEAVSEACLRNEPSMVTRATTEIAKAYNKYYYEHRILDGTESEVAARVEVTKAAQAIIKTGLYLIGVEAPERM